MDSFLGSILAFGFNFAPSGWAFCNGQLLSIQSNSALFALLGTTYGGNGTQNFALPDLRGRTPIGFGQGPGLQNYNIGQASGTENATLSLSNLAPHTHAGSLAVVVPGRSAAAPTANYYLGATQSVDPATSPTTVPLGGVTVASAGSGQPFSILQPYLALNYCICVQGIFPPRS